MNSLTVLAHIKKGEEEVLRELLTEIDLSKADNEYVRFSEYRVTHNARWSVVYDEENGYRLLLALEFDGLFQDFIAEMIATTPGLDRIWGKCVGYRGAAYFEEFIRQNGCETQAFYIGFAQETVASIRMKIRVRRRLEELFDIPYPWIRPFFDVLSKVKQSAGALTWVRQSLGLLGVALQNWWINLMVSIAKPVARAQISQTFSHVSSVCGAGMRFRTQAPSGQFNCQMITISEIKKGLIRYWWLRLTLCVNQYLGQLWPPGLFADVGTIWSFRWVIIDNRKRIIFLSVFDGTWQNYMGDFVDKLIWALDGVYVNVQDYPRGGMTQIDDFKAFILERQFEPQILYRAYPSETVMNLIRDRKLNATLGEEILKPMGISTEAVNELVETL